MAIVYDDEAPTTPVSPAAVQYDDVQPSPPSSSQDVFNRGAAPLPGLVTPGMTSTDKYQQAAIAERDRLQQAGVPLPEGYTRRLMSGPALGWGDEIAAASVTPLEMIKRGTFNPAEGYRYAKAREDLASEAAQQKTGVSGDIAETVGAVATLPGNVFGRQLSTALGGAGRGVLPTAARMAGYGAEAGALGAVQGAGNAPTIQDIPSNALRGGAFGAALGAPFGHFADVVPRSTAVVPEQQELFKLGARDYRARDRVPVAFPTEHIADKLDNLNQANFLRYGRDAPQTTKTITNLADQAREDVNRANALNPNYVPGQVAVPGQGVPNPWQATTRPRDIASLRREIYEGGAVGSPTDERAGTISSKVIDRILTRPGSAPLAYGTPRDAVTAAMLDARGRGNFGAAYRDRAITDQIEKSVTDAGLVNSGLNFGNTLRQNINRARKREEFGNFNPAEAAGVEKLITGTHSANRIREMGNMLGGGGGISRGLVLGGGVGGGALTAYLTGNDPLTGAALGLGLAKTGKVLRAVGNARERAAAEEFSTLLRQRSPEYLSRAAIAPMGPGPGLGASLAGSRMLTIGGGGGVRDAIARSLMANTIGLPPQEQP